jgi:serpin B
MYKFVRLGVIGMAVAGMLVGAVGAQEPPISAELVNSNNQFALDLYHAAEREGNFVFAPYSVSQALAMTYAGARGNTATEMAEVLHFTPDVAELGTAFGDLNTSLIIRGNHEGDPANDEPANELNVANSLWGEQTYPFHQEYLDLIQNSYGAGFQLTDFINDPDAAREDINSWVEEQTHDRIQDIVPENVINPATRLVLANAIYFKGAWAFQFNEDATEDAPFTLLDGTTVDVPMMNQTALFAYGEGDGYRAIALPYYGYNGIAMMIIVPDDFETFEEALSMENLGKVNGSFTYQDVRFSLPRFSFTTDLPLGDTLQAMGMVDAFDPNAADFSGMAEVSPGENLYISAVLHKAFIEVNEEGTEAAGATVVVMDVTSAPVDEPDPIVFKVDQPFFFGIYDQTTGSILFWGRVLNPAE